MTNEQKSTLSDWQFALAELRDEPEEPTPESTRGNAMPDAVDNAKSTLAQTGEKPCKKCGGDGYDHGIGEGLRLQDVPCQQCNGTGKEKEK